MKRIVVIACAGAAFAVLPGCDWFGKSESSGGGEAVIHFGSRAVFSENELQRQLKNLFSARPGTEAMVKGLPREQQLKLYEDFAEESATKLMIREYVAEKGWNATPEFKERAREAHKMLDLDLDVQAFQQELSKEAEARGAAKSEEDLRKFYDEQRALVAKQGEDKLKNFPAFEAVKSQIAEALKNQELQKMVMERIAELRARYDVKVNKDFLNTLVPGAPAAPQEAPASEEGAHEDSEMGETAASSAHAAIDRGAKQAA